MANEHISADSLEPFCHHLLDMLPSYALGTASPDESRAVEAMLPLCPEAQLVLDDYRMIGDALLTMSPLNEAPPPVEALLRRAQAEKPARHAPHMQQAPAVHTLPVQPPARQLHAAPAQHTNGAAKSPAPRDGRPAARPVPQPARRQTGLLWLAAAVACAALFFVGSQVFWAVQIDGLRREQQASLATYTEAISALVSERLETVNMPGLDGANAWALNSANHYRALLPQSDAVSAMAAFVWNSDDQIGALVVQGLPVPETDETYQLWLVRDGHSLSLGTFEPDDSGVGVLIFQASRPIDEYSHIGVSVEPEGGTDMPTSPHLIIGNI
jgi:hypothetical protein